MLNNLLSGNKKKNKKNIDESNVSTNDKQKPSTDSRSDSPPKKVVIVTGGSSGIGAATAIEFATDGFRVAIVGRNKDRLETIWRKMLEASNDHRSEDFLVIQADFADKSQVETVIDHVVKTFGRLDILVNNAGQQGKNKSIKENGFFEEFQNIQQINLHAPLRLCQLAAPHLYHTKGVIINVSSIADRVPLENISYSVSKAGLSMMTKCLANALEGKDVRVVGVAPGPVKTNFTPGMEFSSFVNFMNSLGRMGESKEVANLICFLSSEKASYIHGTIVTIDGGCHSKCSGAFKQPKILKLLM